MATNVNKISGFRGFLRDFVWCFKHFFGMLRFYWRINMGFPITFSLDRDEDNADNVTLF